ncbi:hypothetical protein GN956_G26186, partial [Arapaima gigas]
MSLTISTSVSLIAAVLLKASFAQPQLRGSPRIIGLRDSVHLTCEPPKGFYYQCSFFTYKGMSIRRDSGCSVSITGAELVRLGGHSGGSQINIYCMYRLNSGSFSPGSDPLRVTLSVSLPAPRLTVSSTVISVGGAVELRCELPEKFNTPDV